MNNSSETYKIIFSGSILDGFSREAVTKHFAKAFKLKDKKKIEQLFCGRIITLKRGLNYEEARRYSRVLNKLGADCCLEREYQPLFNAPETDRAYERKKRSVLQRYSQSFDGIGLAPITKSVS